MSAAKHARISRYVDGLIQPEDRILATHKGVQWVTDRFVMVRADMFRRPVTARWAQGDPPKVGEAKMRKVLGDIPRDGKYARRMPYRFITTGSGTLRPICSSWSSPSATLYNTQIDPLLDACDHLRVFDGGRRIAGFQKRPRSAKPVLVCVVMGVHWGAVDEDSKLVGGAS